MMRRLQPSGKLAGASTLLAAALSLGGALAYAADALVIDKDGVKVQPSLEVGSNGPQINDKGATIEGFSGRNFFQDSEKAGALRVGAAWGVPGIYSQKGDIVVGSASKKIWLNGAVRADSFAGKGAVPIGAILMWSGAADKVPAGWALCNGQKTAGAVQTPDLRGRFIVNYDPGNPAYNTIGNTGGSEQVSLTVNQMPKHSHSGTTDNDSGVGTGGGWGGSYVLAKANQESGHWHNHTFKTNEVGGSQPHENRPPYYVLAYIIYTGE